MCFWFFFCNEAFRTHNWGKWLGGVCVCVCIDIWNNLAAEM